MARRGMSGQLNMFDFFNSLEAGAPGEVEMVSLVPEFEDEVQPEEVQPEEMRVQEEPEIAVEAEPVVVEPPVVEETPLIEEPVVVEKAVVHEDLKVAMSRRYEIGGEKIEIAYINYNKVRITRGNEAPVIKEFASSKEAVDYYVEQMQEYEVDE